MSSLPLTAASFDQPVELSDHLSMGSQWTREHILSVNSHSFYRDLLGQMTKRVCPSSALLHIHSYTPPYLFPGDLKAWMIKTCGTLVKSLRSVSEIFLALWKSPPLFPLLPYFQSRRLQVCFTESLLWKLVSFLHITANSSGRHFIQDRLQRITAVIEKEHTNPTFIQPQLWY